MWSADPDADKEVAASIAFFMLVWFEVVGGFVTERLLVVIGGTVVVIGSVLVSEFVAVGEAIVVSCFVVVSELLVVGETVVVIRPVFVSELLVVGETVVIMRSVVISYFLTELEIPNTGKVITQPQTRNRENVYIWCHTSTFSLH